MVGREPTDLGGRGPGTATETHLRSGMCSASWHPFAHRRCGRLLGDPLIRSTLRKGAQRDSDARGTGNKEKRGWETTNCRIEATVDAHKDEGQMVRLERRPNSRT